MANDPSAALAPEPDAPSEEDFQAFLAALSGSARGRAFLAEHARRSRSEDSGMLLSAVQRLESLVLSQTPPPAAADNPIDELRGMLEAIRSVQAELDVSMLAAQVANLTALIENVQQRIETMVAPADVAAVADVPIEAATTPEQPAPAEAEAAPVELEVAPDQAEPVSAEPALAEAVSEPEPEVSELAEPAALPAQVDAPVADAAPPEAPVMDARPAPQAMPEDAWQTIPEVAWCESDSDAAVEATPVDETPANETPADDAAVIEAAVVEATVIEAAVVETAPAEPATEAAPPAGLAVAALVETLAMPSTDEALAAPEATVIKAGTIPPPAPFAGEDFSTAPRARTMPPAVDPLADLKALSDDERVALFT